MAQIGRNNSTGIIQTGRTLRLLAALTKGATGWGFSGSVGVAATGSTAALAGCGVSDVEGVSLAASPLAARAFLARARRCAGISVNAASVGVSGSKWRCSVASDFDTIEAAGQVGANLKRLMVEQLEEMCRNRRDRDRPSIQSGTRMTPGLHLCVDSFGPLD